MRDRFVSCIVVTVFLLLLGIFSAECGVQYLSDEPYVYAVLPGTPEWEVMTPTQRQESCEVTIEEVANMSTEALVETVINYPYLVDIFAFNTINEGIEWVSMYFPGLPELLSREDAVEELQEYQTKMQERVSKEQDIWKIEDAHYLELYIKGYYE